MSRNVSSTLQVAIKVCPFTSMPPFLQTASRQMSLHLAISWHVATSFSMLAPSANIGLMEGPSLRLAFVFLLCPVLKKTPTQIFSSLCHIVSACLANLFPSSQMLALSSLSFVIALTVLVSLGRTLISRLPSDPCVAT